MSVKLPLGLRSSVTRLLRPILPLGLRLTVAAVSGPILPLGLRSEGYSLAMLPRGLVLRHKLSGAILPLGLRLMICIRKTCRMLSERRRKTFRHAPPPYRCVSHFYLHLEICYSASTCLILMVPNSYVASSSHLELSCFSDSCCTLRLVFEHFLVPNCVADFCSRLELSCSEDSGCNHQVQDCCVD